MDLVCCKSCTLEFPRAAAIVACGSSDKHRQQPMVMAAIVTTPHYTAILQPLMCVDLQNEKFMDGAAQAQGCIDTG